MTEEELKNRDEWSRSENWTGLGTYRSRLDTRLWVPKREPGLGSTLNFAHSGAWWSLVGLLSVPIGLVVLFALWSLFR